MPNEKNLIPYQFTSDQSREEAAKNGALGGRASGEARRRKKALKECMNALLDLPVTGAGNYNALSQLGVDPEDIDNRMLVAAALFQRAVKTGDPKTVHEIREILNETDQESENGILSAVIEAVRDVE